MNVFDELKWRGFIAQDTGVDRTSEHMVCYVGFDPTADSLHVGSLLPLIAMRHMKQAGHKVIALVGGATGMIGDPSGKSSERKVMSVEQIKHNAEALTKQIKSIVGEDVRVVNNIEWFESLGYISFLRDIGAHFRVNNMLRSECFRSRMERENGLSFLEFNYMLLQAYDFFILNQRFGCTLQMGGNDQWSNILAGIDLVKKMENTDVFGMTFPLLTTSSGSKMGKTEQGAVWMDESKTSSHEFFQFWRNVEDGDVERFLKLFTDLSQRNIGVMTERGGDSLNLAKKVLAYEVTRLCRGEQAATRARDAALLFDGNVAVQQSLEPVCVTVDIDTVQLIDIMKEAGVVSSKTVARTLIKQGGVTVDGQKVTDEKVNVIAPGEFLLRIGKKKFIKIQVKRV